jgi:hypothetical protein
MYLLVINRTLAAQSHYPSPIRVVVVPTRLVCPDEKDQSDGAQVHHIFAPAR